MANATRRRMIPCDGCGKPKRVPNKSAGHNLCRGCAVERRPDQPCAVCGVMQQRTRCDKHLKWGLTNCHTCGTETYSSVGKERRAYCAKHAPGQGCRGIVRTCRHCAAPIPKGSPQWRKACDTCVAEKPWMMKRSSVNRKTCNRCGTAKWAPGSDPDVYTCDPCRREIAGLPAVKYRARKRPPGSRRTDYRQRAKRFGVEYEPINRQKVFARDGWRCGICREKVDRRLRYPDVMSATLDHVIPLSLGGGHLYVNVTIAHLRCNLLKSNRLGGDQLALIG